MVPRTGSRHMRLPPASCFCPGVAPLVRRGFLLADGRGQRQPKALASGDAGATDASRQYSPYIACVPRTPFIEPSAPVLRSAPPTGPAWLHEVKHDGWRAQLHKAGDDVVVRPALTSAAVAASPHTWSYTRDTAYRRRMRSRPALSSRPQGPS